MKVAKMLIFVGIFTLTLILFLVHRPQNIRHYAAGVQPVGQSSGWNMIFDDEFDGSALDLSKWTPNWLGPDNTAITSQFGDTCADPRAIQVANGELDINATADPCTVNNGTTYPYRSGLIESNGKFNFTYGYMEARIWQPAGTGMWPAFWSDGQIWPQDGEVDVLEGNGTGNSSYHYHYAGSGFVAGLAGCSDSCGPGGSVVVPGATAGWHTYAADWEPGVITWYYDGHQVWQWTTSVTSSPMYLIVNLALNSKQSAVPATMKVDYVRVWQKCTTNCTLVSSSLTSTNTSIPAITPTNKPEPTFAPFYVSEYDAVFDEKTGGIKYMPLEASLRRPET